MKERYLALDHHKIPCEVIHTDLLVEWLMRIAEAKPFLDEYLGSPQEVKLLRKAKVRAITYSNQIEGNALGEGEVTAVLRGRRVAGSPKDIKEIRNSLGIVSYRIVSAFNRSALSLNVHVQQLRIHSRQKNLRGLVQLKKQKSMNHHAAKIQQ